jgi:hypothetical protein
MIQSAVLVLVERFQRAIADFLGHRQIQPKSRTQHLPVQHCDIFDELRLSAECFVHRFENQIDQSTKEFIS